MSNTVHRQLVRLASEEATGLSTQDLTMFAAEFGTEQPLREAVHRVLRATGCPALRGLAIEIIDDVVIIRGGVPSYYQKQLAQEIAGQVVGVRTVVNEAEVACCR